VAVVEVAMAALFAGLGVPPNVAVVGVLTYLGSFRFGCQR